MAAPQWTDEERRLFIDGTAVGSCQRVKKGRVNTFLLEARYRVIHSRRKVNFREAIN